MIYRERTINCVKDNLLREKVTQQEHGAVNFAFTVMNGRELIDLTECQQAVYYGTKPDGHVIGNVCTVENDKVIMPLTLQMTTCEGLLEGIIELQYNDGNIRFYGVNFEVYPAPESANIESTDDFTILEATIAEARELLKIADNKLDKPAVSGTEGQVLTLSEDGTTKWETPTGGTSVDKKFLLHSSTTITEPVKSITLDLPSEFDELYFSISQTKASQYFSVDADGGSVACMLKAGFGNVNNRDLTSWLIYNLSITEAIQLQCIPQAWHKKITATNGLSIFSNGLKYGNSGYTAQIQWTKKNLPPDYSQITVVNDTAGSYFNAGVTVDIYYK